jgi:hypothetical protein
MQKTLQTKRKHTGGRPQLTEEQRRCIRVQPSFTLAEFEALEERAAKAGLEISEWLRTAGLGLAINSVPTVNRSAYSELANLASNVSKLTSQTYTTGNVSSDALAKLLIETREKVQFLRSELVGGVNYDW